MENKNELMQFASELLAKTQQRKILWQPASFPLMYEATLKRGFKVAVEWNANYRTLKHEICITVSDKENKLIATISTGELNDSSLLDKLYEAIQDQTLPRDWKAPGKVKDALATLRSL